MADNRLTLYGPNEVSAALERMAADILRRQNALPVLVGIRRGGAHLMSRLKVILEEKTATSVTTGVVDINLYRDDWTLARSLPKVGPTDLPFKLEGKRIILVDDVLYTGRTVRAALGALAEFGRASRVELMVLVDRGHREMPIQPDYTPFCISTLKSDIVEVTFQENGPGIEVVLIA
ncbi:MAG: bifunctional pyr operon transcriptional regulator/uracil phosphoribosyltransferase PyrR [Deltaproteobacteria bacterium]|jgi:pyrimidine operon attenuation protein/uracil phosphoribosyltransferase|nr:bifunctional pyr operon transcriptional regulator/uracil phosphoribosyltransferase PyrR [Deltaproteobacteria bacterium]